MKTLKMKSVLFSLLAMMAVSSFMVSCGQEELITDEIAEVNLTELTEKLAENPNFQSSIEVHEKIGNDIIEFINENRLDVVTDEATIDAFLSTYTVGKVELAEYKANLLNELPELNSVSEEALEEVASSAYNLVVKNEVITRNCWDVFRFCAHTAYLRYFHGYINYATYLQQHQDCVDEYYDCL